MSKVDIHDSCRLRRSPDGQVARRSPAWAGAAAVSAWTVSAWMWTVRVDTGAVRAKGPAGQVHRRWGGRCSTWRA